MKRHLPRSLAAFALIALLAVPALAQDLVVLVDPEGTEAAQIQALGYTAASSMEELILYAGEEPCIVGLAYSGFAAADLDWFTARLAKGTTLVGWGWDAETLVADRTGMPEYVPDLITIGYVYNGVPISYALNSPDELAQELQWACLYLDGDSLEGLGFDPSEIDFTAMLDEALPHLGPFLRMMDAFLRPQWEYQVVPVEGADLADVLNTLGADGWELVTIASGNLVLKRNTLDGESLIRLIFELAQSVTEQAEDAPWF